MSIKTTGTPTPKFIAMGMDDGGSAGPEGETKPSIPTTQTPRMGSS